jgi:hypothetical protein
MQYPQKGGGAVLGSVSMTHRLHFADIRLAEKFAKPRAVSEDRLPVGTAMTIIAGASIVLWSLIAIAVASVI